MLNIGFGIAGVVGALAMIKLGLLLIGAGTILGIIFGVLLMAIQIIVILEAILMIVRGGMRLLGYEGFGSATELLFDGFIKGYLGISNKFVDTLEKVVDAALYVDMIIGVGSIFKGGYKLLSKSKVVNNVVGTLKKSAKVAEKAIDGGANFIRKAGNIVDDALGLTGELKFAGTAGMLDDANDFNKAAHGVDVTKDALKSTGLTDGVSDTAKAADNASDAAKGSGNVVFYVGKDGNIASSIDEYNWYANKSNIGNPVDVAGYGNKGRVLPNNLNEQMAMQQVMSNPLNGANQLPFKMTDTRWSYTDGWVKMQNIVKHADGSQTNIHYVYNKITGIFDDFKYKSRGVRYG